MCGRYSVIPKAKRKSHASKFLESYQQEANYNAAPSQKLPVVTNDHPNEVQFFSWGLQPFWAKDAKAVKRSINARAETLIEKPSFRTLLKSKRCLVPADGFYEWQASTHGKVPYRVLLKNEELFSFAGLWDEWVDRSSGEVLHTYTIITTSANEVVKPIHDRMPVILSPEAEELWLDEHETQENLLSLLKPFKAEDMKTYQVSPLVNSPLNNVPEVINSL
ncbi:SOS response-associated peptidase [Pontibacter sp. BT310]|uniref:Abasic site processing protein n=1 Tax=Pontibacter populi TaxID=890055 RepID=A0ABS6XD34_9BACT|nr:MULTISPECIES: SOS response-associated peptidase [Pontibacter]MBJ6119015.1 SOS response-associated peptidase [Pontibacter sp. BT310]MBR0571443.1 SOS response-associated peptidase [Microvirga sp. STS03]MBW3365869.1 SOS response-associated peptidase [Pontibacter populi]